MQKKFLQKSQNTLENDPKEPPPHLLHFFSWRPHLAFSFASFCQAQVQSPKFQSQDQKD